MQMVKKRVRQNATLARRAIADFIDANIPRFNGWLNQVANGIPQVDKDGKPQFTDTGLPVYLVKPDPLSAMKLVGDLAEYHLPKLSRQDVQLTGVIANLDGNELSPENLQKLSIDDLKRMAVEMMQRRNDTDVIDVVPTVVDEPLPSWLDPT